MKKKILPITMFLSFMTLFGCGGDNQENSSVNILPELNVENNSSTGKFDFDVDQVGNYYFDFNKMNSNVKAIVNADGSFYGYDTSTKEGYSGDQDGVKVYYTTEKILKFNYQENNVVSIDVLDRKKGFIKRLFSIVKDNQLYVQETTDVDVLNLDESKPLIQYIGYEGEVNKITDAIWSKNSDDGKTINFSFFSKAFASDTLPYSTSEYLKSIAKITYGILGIAIAAVSAAPGAMVLPVILTVICTKIIYDNVQNIKAEINNLFGHITKKAIEGLNGALDLMVSSANASDLEAENWLKKAKGDNPESKFSGIYKLSFRQTECTGFSSCLTFGSDKNQGDLYFDSKKKEGIVAVMIGHIEGGAYSIGTKLNVDANSFELSDTKIKLKGMYDVPLNSQDLQHKSFNLSVDFNIDTEQIANKQWGGNWAFNFPLFSEISYDKVNNIHYFGQSSEGVAKGYFTLTKTALASLPVFQPEHPGTCYDTTYIVSKRVLLRRDGADYFDPSFQNGSYGKCIYGGFNYLP